MDRIHLVVVPDPWTVSPELDPAAAMAALTSVMATVSIDNSTLIEGCRQIQAAIAKMTVTMGDMPGPVRVAVTGMDGHIEGRAWHEPPAT